MSVNPSILNETSESIAFASTYHLESAPLSLQNIDEMHTFNLSQDGRLFASRYNWKDYPFFTEPLTQVFYYCETINEFKIRKSPINKKFTDLFINGEYCFDYNTILLAGEYLGREIEWNDLVLRHFKQGNFALKVVW